MSAYIIHLRLSFQFLLSPVFLLGYLLADGKLDPRFFIAYLAFHFFGYAGGTALNSAYDRDEGPISGLEHPPQPPPHLLAFSLAWQFIGFILALIINPSFAAIYFVMFWMSLLYSHPRTRVKGHPVLAILTVAVGQGVLAFLGGWTAARGDILSAFSSPAIFGALATMFISVGLYPITEIYQLDEDARRGDLTPARWLGVTRAFWFARICAALGGISALVLTLTRFTPPEAVALALGVTVIEIYLTRWAKAFNTADTYGNFRRVMRVYSLTTFGFIIWLAARLALATFS